MNYEEKGVRHNVTIDAMSIIDQDASEETLEDEVFSNFTLTNMIRCLRNPLDKFVTIAIVYGFQKNEIGFMLDIHPSTVTRLHQDIQRKLRRFQEMSESDTINNTHPQNEREAIIRFLKNIYPKDLAIRRLK